MNLNGPALSYSVVNKTPVIKAMLDKGEQALLFDTGAPMCNIDAEYARAKPGEIVAMSIELGGKKQVLEWRAKDLGVTKKALGTVGTLGNNLLSLHIVYFDTKKKIIYLLTPDDPPPPTRAE